MAKSSNRFSFLQGLALLFFAFLLGFQYTLHSNLPSALERPLKSLRRETGLLATNGIEETAVQEPVTSLIPIDSQSLIHASSPRGLSHGDLPPSVPPHLNGARAAQQAAELSPTTPLSVTKRPKIYHAPLEQTAVRPNKIAVVIPYIGAELPPWFPLFAASAAAHAHLADWLLFTAGTKIPSDANGDDASAWLPPNVKFIEVGLTGLAQLHARLVDPVDRPLAATLLESTLRDKPYYLVEFKPAIGHVFAEYLTNYSHWAFSDLDLVLGDLASWTDELLQGPEPKGDDEEKDWDLFTWGFGDQQRQYTRGQWTVHRNTDKVNQVWRDCVFLVGRRLMQRLQSHARYESAEGCYALAVSQRQDLRVKYAVKAFTDAAGGSELGQEVYLSHGRVLKPTFSKNSRHLLTAPPPALLYHLTALPSLSLASNLRSSTSGLPQQPQQPMQWDLKGARATLVHRAAQQRCMYWVGPRYQTCLEGVNEVSGDSPQGVNLVLEEGRTYARPYVSSVDNVFLASRGGGGETAATAVVKSAAFFHFQEWKKQYRSWSCHLPPRGLANSPILASKTGFIPLLPLAPTSNSLAVEEALTVGGQDPQSWVYATRGSLKYCARWSWPSGKCTKRFRAGDLLTVRGHGRSGDGGGGVSTSSNGHGSSASISSPVHSLENSSERFLESLREMDRAYKDAAAARRQMLTEKSWFEAEASKDVRFDVTLAAVAVVCHRDALIEAEKFTQEDGDKYSDQESIDNLHFNDKTEINERVWGSDWDLLEWHANTWMGPKRFVVALCGGNNSSSDAVVPEWALSLVARSRQWHSNADTSFVVLPNSFQGSHNIDDINSEWGAHGEHVCRKAFLNAAIDLTTTRYVLPLPPRVSIPHSSAHAVLREAFAEARRTREVKLNELPPSEGEKSHNKTPAAISLVLPLWESTSNNACLKSEDKRQGNKKAPLWVTEGDISDALANKQAASFTGRSLEPCEHSDTVTSKGSNGPQEQIHNLSPAGKLVASQLRGRTFHHALRKEAPVVNHGGQRTLHQLQEHRDQGTNSGGSGGESSENQGRGRHLQPSRRRDQGLIASEEGGWVNNNDGPQPSSLSGNPSPSARAAAPLVAWDTWSPVASSSSSSSSGTFGSSSRGEGVGGVVGTGMRLLSLRLVEEHGWGCLDTANAWAAKELQFATLESMPSGSPAFGVAVQTTEKAPGWDVGCAADTNGALEVWSAYKMFVRRAAAVYASLDDAVNER